jgi:hypothetical protein
MGIYLRKGETFEEVVKQDSEVLEKAGVTHKQVGDALEKVLKCYDWSYLYNPINHKTFQESLKYAREIRERKDRVNDTLSISGVAYMGIDTCPFDENIGSGQDYFVYGIPNGNKAGRAEEKEALSPDRPTMVSAMMPTLIRKLHFFEGTVPYGIKPEWAMQIYRIVEKEGANIWVQKRKLGVKN